MHINFNKEMRQNNADRLPDLVITQFNKDLPEGTEYKMDSDGDLVLKAKGDSISIGGLSLMDIDEIEDKIGNNATQADILEYSYNSQKPLRLKTKKEGYLKINGKDIPIDKIKFNPLHSFEYSDGNFQAIPQPFPKIDDITIGCEEYSRTLGVQRIPYDGIDKIKIQSNQKDVLQITLTYNVVEKNSNISISAQLKNAKNIRDIVEAIYIYNAFIDGKGLLDGEKVTITKEEKNIKKFNENYALFWRRTLEVEEILNKAFNITFIPTKGDIDEDTVSIIEELYQSLILKEPVRLDKHIKDIKGALDIKDKIDINELMKKKFFISYIATNHIEIFETEFELNSLDGILDALVNEYQIAGDQLILTLKNDGTGDDPFIVTMLFLNENEANEYRKNNEKTLEKIFRNAVPLKELVDPVFE